MFVHLNMQQNSFTSYQIFYLMKLLAILLDNLLKKKTKKTRQLRYNIIIFSINTIYTFNLNHFSNELNFGIFLHFSLSINVLN